MTEEIMISRTEHGGITASFEPCFAKVLYNPGYGLPARPGEVWMTLAEIEKLLETFKAYLAVTPRS